MHWTPPKAALEAVAAAATDPALSQYGPDAGMPQLREALLAKLAAENDLHQASLSAPEQLSMVSGHDGMPEADRGQRHLHTALMPLFTMETLIQTRAALELSPNYHHMTAGGRHGDSARKPGVHEQCAGKPPVSLTTLRVNLTALTAGGRHGHGGRKSGVHKCSAGVAGRGRCCRAL